MLAASGASRSLRRAMTANSVVRSVVVIAVACALPACSSCLKKKGVEDAGPPDTGAVDAAVEDAAPEASTDDAGTDAEAPAPTASGTGKAAAGGPWAGTYKCFGGMHLAQSGSHVTSTMKDTSTTDTVLSCNVSGDKCNGTIQDVSHPKGKPTKVLRTRKIVLQREANGDVSYRPESTEPTFCRRQK